MADYVNGREMHEELVEYNRQYKLSLEAGTGLPRVSDKLGAAFVQISTRMMNRPNFSGYSYKDDMIADAILQCFTKVHTYLPEKIGQESGSAFSFFSQVVWNSAIARIKKEQHQSSVKARLIRNKMSSEFVAHGADYDSEDSSNSFVEFLKENDAYIDYHELKVEALKKPSFDSLKHRNKTPYKKKDVVPVKEVPVEVSLADFEV